VDAAGAVHNETDAGWPELHAGAGGEGGSGYGSGRSKSSFTTLKMAELAPIPMASERTITAQGFFAKYATHSGNPAGGGACYPGA